MFNTKRVERIIALGGYDVPVGFDLFITVLAKDFLIRSLYIKC